MRRTHATLIASGAAIAALALGLAGCSPEPSDSPSPSPSPEPTPAVSVIDLSGKWEVNVERTEDNNMYSAETPTFAWDFEPCNGEPCAGYIDDSRGPRTLSYVWDGETLSVTRLGDPAFYEILGCTHDGQRRGLYEAEITIVYGPFAVGDVDAQGRPLSLVGERTDSTTLATARETEDYAVNAELCNAVGTDLEHWIAELDLQDGFARSIFTLTPLG